MALTEFDAPIPGENFTSDTKNYPWHRPPEFDDLDSAIEYIGRKLLDEDASVAALTMMEAGMTIVSIAQMFMMNGIMEGKWTFDYAILLAGPTAHILYILAKSYGIDCDLGIDGKEKPITVSLLKAMAGIKEEIDPGAARDAANEAVAAVVGEENDVGFGNPAEEEKPQEGVQGSGATPTPGNPSAAPTGFMGAAAPAPQPVEQGAVV